LHINNYSDGEIEASWYDIYKLKLMRRKIRFAVSLLANGMLAQDNESCCRRGVEGLAQNVALQRRENRSAAREAVLFEQEHQWDEGICEPEYIARVYKEANVSSQASGRDIALIDEILDAMI
jgi:hypothetical protein